jgi:hypothetical protein
VIPFLPYAAGYFKSWFLGQGTPWISQKTAEAEIGLPVPIKERQNLYLKDLFIHILHDEYR